MLAHIKASPSVPVIEEQRCEMRDRFARWDAELQLNLEQSLSLFSKYSQPNLICCGPKSRLVSSWGVHCLSFCGEARWCTPRQSVSMYRSAVASHVFSDGVRQALPPCASFHSVETGSSVQRDCPPRAWSWQDARLFLTGRKMPLHGSHLDSLSTLFCCGTPQRCSLMRSILEAV